MQKILVTQEELTLGEGRFDQYMRYVLQRMTNASCVPELAVFQAIDVIKNDGYAIKFGSESDSAGIAVANWIGNNVGARQDISYCLPQVVHQIFGITYFLRMPILRQSEMLLTQAVVELTPDLERLLSAGQLSRIADEYNEFYDALEQVVKFDATTVVHLESAAQRIYDGEAHYALSRWESLHFVERAMKEVLEPLGIKETGRDGHDVAGILHARWQAVGKKPLPQSLLDDVDCSADIRYLRSPTSYIRTIKAHHASIRLVAQIAEDLKPVAPMMEKMIASIKDLKRGPSLLIARMLPALIRDQTRNRRVTLLRSDDPNSSTPKT